MPRSQSLPRQLRYLEPFRRLLNGLEPEEFNEDMDQSLLHNLVLNRTEGLAVDEAARVLEADGLELKNWLSSSGQGDESLLWLEAQFSVLPGLIEDLRSQPIESKSKLEVQMEFPNGVRKKRMQHGILKATV